MNDLAVHTRNEPEGEPKNKRIISATIASLVTLAVNSDGEVTVLKSRDGTTADMPNGMQAFVGFLNPQNLNLLQHYVEQRLSPDPVAAAQRHAPDLTLTPGG